MTTEEMKEVLEDLKSAKMYASRADTIAFRMENEIDTDEDYELWDIVSDADELLCKAVDKLDKAIDYIEEKYEVEE